jgi:hypothetical protein
MKPVWTWNGGRRCWESDGLVVYPTKGGGFVIANDDSWMPGCYDSREAAELALGRDALALQELQARKNAEAGGSGGIITVADLTDKEVTRAACGRADV